MFFKKIFAILISGIVLCTSLTASAYAETTYSFVDSDISPAYEIASETLSILSISERTAYCTSEAYGADAVSITVEQTLQKQGFLWLWYGVPDASWITTVEDNSLLFVNTKDDLSDGKYRLMSVFTLTDKYGKTETITVYSDEKSVG